MDTGAFAALSFFKQPEVNQELCDSLKISHFLQQHLPDARPGGVQWFQAGCVWDTGQQNSVLTLSWSFSFSLPLSPPVYWDTQHEPLECCGAVGLARLAYCFYGV